jgi:hypothetical protein
MQPILMALIGVVLTGLTTWMFRVDDRMYTMFRDSPSRAELAAMRTELTARLDRIEGLLMTLSGPRQTAARP